MSMNNVIWQDLDFIIDAPSIPHISRDDGGHVRISPIVPIIDRTRLSVALATKLMLLTMITGEAMSKVMNDHGVDIGRINYQDNGNCGLMKPLGASLHIHLYGRAKSAKKFPYGTPFVSPCYETDPGFFKDHKPLNDNDITALRALIIAQIKSEKYSGYFS